MSLTNHGDVTALSGESIWYHSFSGVLGSGTKPAHRLPITVAKVSVRRTHASSYIYANAAECVMKDWISVILLPGTILSGVGVTPESRH